MEGSIAGVGHAPMLTKVYRCGPSRQRVCKGYVLAGPDAARSRDAVVAACHALARDEGLVLRVDERHSHAVWLDTGLTWLHVTAERERLARRLGRIVSALADQANAAGVRLLPGGVRLDDSEEWSLSVCGDEHFIETSSEREKTAYANLVRHHLPELIALTGRAGVGPGGVEKLCSRRLADSDRHVAARHFVSLAPGYLAHVVKALVRDEGVRRLDLLDVDPRAHGSGTALADSTVALRFVDGQVSIRSTLAHALLFEALLIRARRMVAQDKTLPLLPQRDLERNRASAIAHGLDAQFQTIVYGGQGRGKSGPQRSARAQQTKGKQAAAADARQVTREVARDALKRLLDGLEYEFQALEVSLHELSPLLLGVSLRAWGVSGLQNENDLLRVALAKVVPDGIYERLATLMTNAERRDPLSAYNKQLFAKQVMGFEAEWKGRLRPRVNVGTERASGTVRAEPGRGAERHASEPNPPAEPTEGGERARKRVKLRQAVQRLQQRLSENAAADETELHRALSDFASQSGAKDIARVLKVLSDQDGKRLLRRLTDRARVYELHGDAPSRWTWDGEELAIARGSTGDRGVLRFSTALANESALDSAIQRLLNADSTHWMLVVLERRRDTNTSVVQRDLLIVRSRTPGAAGAELEHRARTEPHRSTDTGSSGVALPPPRVRRSPS